MAENQKKTFAEQVDDVLNGTYPKGESLMVREETPFILRQVGFRNLPMLTSQSHIKAALHPKSEENQHLHGLTLENLNEMPACLESPVMIMDSLTNSKSIVVLTDKLDSDGLPIIVSIRADGNGMFNHIDIESNYITSYYGKDDFEGFLSRNLNSGSVLYWDKEKSQALLDTMQLQLPQALISLDSDTIIRKSAAFVNTQEQEKSENTEKNEETMENNTNLTAQNAREKVQQVRDAMVKTLLEHIEKNPTDWQAGWNSFAGGAPYNGKTKTAYRGLNSLYLAVVGMARGFKDPRWVTFNQAKDLKASVKKGEKSVPVLFFDYYDKATKKFFDARTVRDMTEEEKKAYIKENVYAVLKYSSVFNAEQCHNFPERTVDEFKMPAEERENQNEAIETIIANSAAPVLYDGGNRAYYSPGTDKIHIPAIDDFDTMQDYYATALHEIAHSTGHHTRLNRDMSGGFGSESYAKEELRAELACVFMQLEQGIKLEGKHIENHAAYLSSWLDAAKKDSSVFFKAASDAQKIADYVADHYLQSVNSSELVAESEEENTKENAAQLDPMTAYMQSEQQKRAAAPNSLDRLDENVKEWYTAMYPTDDLGQEINDKITFADIQATISSGKDIYEVLGVSDNLVRERAWARLAELRGTTYANVYDEWIEGWQATVRNEANERVSKFADARALAQRLAQETGEPYVTVEWTEKSNGFPNINALDILPLSEADKKFSLLDAQAEGAQGYYKTKLHIDFVFEGKPESYENCRFDIGTEGGGIVHHIDEFLKYDTFLDDEERAEAEAALEYLQRHMEISAYLSDPKKLAELSEEEQRDINKYVADARDVLNTTAPFSNYRDNMPPTPEQLKQARERAEQIAWEDFPRDFKGDHEEETNSAFHYSINFSLDYSNDMLLANELQKLGFEEDKTVWEENSRIDDINTQNGNGVWLNRIRYTAPNGKALEGFFGRTFNGIMLEARNITGFTSTGLTEEEVQAVAEIIKDFGIDVEVSAIPIQLNAGANEHTRSHEKKDDTPPNMSQTTQNLPNLADREEYEFKALKILVESAQKGEPIGEYITFADYNYLFRTNDLALKYGGEVENGSVIVNETLANSYNELRKKYDTPPNISQTTQNSAQNANSGKREWLTIELPDGALGAQYGENTMVKMPRGEFSGYALFISSKLVKEENGKKYLRIASDFDLRLNNDGKQVVLTGAELKDSFNGVRLDKTYKRVAPSRRFAKGLENLEKNVPAELKAIPAWCCYRTKWNDEKGKKDKFLISTKDGKWISSKEPERWVSFDSALKYARENNCEGLSLLLDRKYGITCIDLDKCILNAETGEMKQRATRLVNELKGTYIERSTSGNGVHIFLKDDILKSGTYNGTSQVKAEDPRGDLEVFDEKHIISMTGDMLSENNVLSRAGSAATLYLRQELGERKQYTNQNKSATQRGSLNLNDNELIKWIRGSKQGGKFDDLYSGRGVSGNRSADDAKLAHLLLYFNGGDEQQAFRIMREAGSYRPDKPDSYYQSTIKKMNEKITEYAKHPNSSSADKKHGRFGGSGNNGSQA